MRRRGARTSRPSTWRKWLYDFVKHFVGDYRSRYGPVWTCLQLTLGAGLATLLTFVIAYRALNWLGGWLVARRDAMDRRTPRR